MARPPQTTEFAACEQEIHELHRFFQSWFQGEVPDEEPIFERLTRALAGDFMIITPTGRSVAYSALIAGLRADHGSWREKEGGRIWIENVRPLRQFGEAFLLTYEEWQSLDGSTRGRLSTVLMRRAEVAPGGVQWLHLHEVWLPSEEKGAVPGTIASQY